MVPIVVPLLLTLGDTVPAESKVVVGKFGTLFVGIAKTGSPVGVEGKLTIGRPNESTLLGVMGSTSRLGVGMERGGGPVIVGITVEGELSDMLGRVVEGMTRLLGLRDGVDGTGDVVEGRMRLVRVVVAEERTTVANVLMGKLIDERLTVGRLNDGGDTLAAGIPIEPRLMDGKPGILRLIAEGIASETKGTLIGPGVGTGIPTYSTLTDTTCGGFAGVLLLLWMACRIDSTDVGGWLVGTLVSEGIWTGLAAMRETRRKRRVVERCMALPFSWNLSLVLPFFFFFFFLEELSGSLISQKDGAGA